ncbi:MAG: VWA domain-containing protein [Terriglobia bacterium]
MRFKRLLALLCCLVFTAVFSEPAWSQQRTQAPVNISTNSTQTDPAAEASVPKSLSSIHIQSSLVETPVTVRNGAGDFIQNLSKNDFKVLDNGAPQRIVKFGQATQPVALVILVQTNQAVAPLLDQVRPLGPLFSNLLLGKKGEAAVVCFDTKVRVMQSFAADPAMLGQTLQHITDEGTRARLNDALARAILMLSSRPPAERRIIVAFSEGLDRGSETTKEEIIRAATGADVAIYGLQFKPAAVLLNNPEPSPQPDVLDDNLARPGRPGAPNTPGTLQQYYSMPNMSALPLISGIGNMIASAGGNNLLKLYAEFTGGTVFSHWKSNQLQKQLTQVALEVNSQYMLAYVPSTLDEAGFHRVQVHVTQPGLKVKARAGYFYKPKSK